MKLNKSKSKQDMYKMLYGGLGASKSTFMLNEMMKHPEMMESMLHFDFESGIHDSFVQKILGDSKPSISEQPLEQSDYQPESQHKLIGVDPASEQGDETVTVEIDPLADDKKLLMYLECRVNELSNALDSAVSVINNQAATIVALGNRLDALEGSGVTVPNGPYDYDYNNDKLDDEL